jgi:hypothetical protein
LITASAEEKEADALFGKEMRHFFRRPLRLLTARGRNPIVARRFKSFTPLCRLSIVEYFGYFTFYPIQLPIELRPRPTIDHSQTFLAFCDDCPHLGSLFVGQSESSLHPLRNALRGVFRVLDRMNDVPVNDHYGNPGPQSKSADQYQEAE